MFCCFKQTQKMRFFKPQDFEIRDLRDEIQMLLKTLAKPIEDYTDYAYKYHFLELLLESYNKDAVKNMQEDVYNYYKQKADTAINSLKEHQRMESIYKAG